MLSLTITAGQVLAEEKTATTTTKSVRTEVRKEVREVKQEAKTTITQIREEKRATVSAMKQKKAQTTFNTIKTNLVKRHEELLKAKAKLEARIAKNPMKKDVTSAVAKLKEFDAAEANYIKDLAALDAKFAELNLVDAKPTQIISALKTSSDLIRKDLNNIKQILINATRALAQAPKLEVTKTE